MHTRTRARLHACSDLCVGPYIAADRPMPAETHPGRNVSLAKKKKKQASSEYLKIALDWQPNYHHYSFHHYYQPCGAHAVGGQSRCFHGAFPRLSIHTAVMLLFFSNAVLCFSSVICSSRPSTSLLLLLLLVYFFPLLICLLLWKHWRVISNTV